MTNFWGGNPPLLYETYDHTILQFVWYTISEPETRSGRVIFPKQNTLCMPLYLATLHYITL